MAEVAVCSALHRPALAVGEGRRSGLHDHQCDSEYSELGLAFCVDQGVRFRAHWR